MAIISRQTKNPMFFAIYYDSLETLEENLYLHLERGEEKQAVDRIKRLKTRETSMSYR